MLLPGKVLLEGLISQVKRGGFAVKCDRAVSIGTEIALEFFIKYRGKPTRIRVKAKVATCRLESSGDALLQVAISEIGREESHTLNNVLQSLEESTAFDLRSKD